MSSLRCGPRRQHVQPVRFIGQRYERESRRISQGARRRQRARAQTWPSSAHNGAANTGSGSCSQVGYHIDFTPVELRERYGSQQNYIDEVARITGKAKRDGFLVSADADRTIEEAKTVKF